MEDLKDKLIKTCDSTVSALNTYYEVITNSGIKDKKASTAKHYNFLSQFLGVVKENDTLINELSNAIVQADINNDTSSVQKLSDLFDICTQHRKNLEDYFTASESALKQNVQSMHASLRNSTYLLIRKTTKLKDLIQR